MREVLTHQVDDPGSRQPDRDEDGDQLGESEVIQAVRQSVKGSPSPDTGAGLQNVEVLQNVRESHQTESSEKSQTNPGSERENSFV